MAWVEITYWREIPVLVRASEGDVESTVPLSPRFQDLVDLVAIQDGLSESGAYLAEWRTGPGEEKPGSAPTVAHAVAAALEARFGEIRARHVRAGGSY